jgi:ATP dependent DNA ligase domain
MQKMPARLRFIPPMECLEVHRIPEGNLWQYELKLDGYRAIAVKQNEDVDLFSRNGTPFNSKFPSVVQALQKLRMLLVARRFLEAKGSAQPVTCRRSSPNRGTAPRSGKRESLKSRPRVTDCVWLAIPQDKPSKAGWSWGWVSGVDSPGRTIFVADAHRDDGKRFVVTADEKLTAFLELERNRAIPVQCLVATFLQTMRSKGHKQMCAP